MRFILILIAFGFVIAKQTSDEYQLLLLSRDDSVSPPVHEIYAYTVGTGHVTRLLSAETEAAFLSSGLHGHRLDEEPPTPTPPFSPIVAPRWVSLGERVDLLAMSGETSAYINIFDADFNQLTDVKELFADATQPLISASANFIAWRPSHDAFLYRARAVDADGQAYNRLLLFDDFTAAQTNEMPFFGKDPVWSPDGVWLVGSRWDGQRLYQLEMVEAGGGETRTIANGCNPQWSPDGRWIAFDAHSDSAWQGYTDCFADGTVSIYDVESGEILQVEVAIPKFVTVMGWYRQ